MIICKDCQKIKIILYRIGCLATHAHQTCAVPIEYLERTCHLHNISSQHKICCIYILKWIVTHGYTKKPNNKYTIKYFKSMLWLHNLPSVLQWMFCSWSTIKSSTWKEMFYYSSKYLSGSFSFFVFCFQLRSFYWSTEACASTSFCKKKN